MGKIPNGILGAVTGTVGTVVGAVIRGVATIRTRPKKSTKPAVQAQINQRSKFGLVTSFFSPITDLINLGYQAFNTVMSPSNEAVKYHLDNAVTGVYPDYKLDMSKVVISKGKLPGSSTIEAVAVAGANINITWDSSAEFGEVDLLARNLDYGVMVVYNELTESFFLNRHGLTRAAKSQPMHFPRAYVGPKLHLWFFFVREDGKLVSKSQYLGAFTLIA